MKLGTQKNGLKRLLKAILWGATPAVSSVEACTRIMYVGAENQIVLTGRTMDWNEDLAAELYVLPAGLKRKGGSAGNSPSWVSRYGSLCTVAYNLGVADGLNEKGLSLNVLYLTESDYGEKDETRPQLAMAFWPSYILDNFASVAEAVEVLKDEPFQIEPLVLPNGRAASVHISLSDPTGDSAIFEYIDGKLRIYHSKEYQVMTNSPTYDKQLAINEYWDGVGGFNALPGTNRAADRFVRASFFLNALPRKADARFMSGVPNQSPVYEDTASALSILRAVSVPLGLVDEASPNLSSTIFRAMSDQTNMVYYFESTARPNLLRVELAKLDFKMGAPIMKLALAEGQVYEGEVSGKFKASSLYGQEPVKA